MAAFQPLLEHWWALIPITYQFISCLQTISFSNSSRLCPGKATLTTGDQEGQGEHRLCKGEARFLFPQKVLHQDQNSAVQSHLQGFPESGACPSRSADKKTRVKSSFGRSSHDTLVQTHFHTPAPNGLHSFFNLDPAPHNALASHMLAFASFQVRPLMTGATVLTACRIPFFNPSGPGETGTTKASPSPPTRRETKAPGADGIFPGPQGLHE